jgi:hypothetical protein
MDFQGQRKALTGECEVLAFIDIYEIRYSPRTSRSESSQFVPAFLDRVVFQHVPSEVLHSDEAPESMSALMQALADISHGNRDENHSPS